VLAIVLAAVTHAARSIVIMKTVAMAVMATVLTMSLAARTIARRGTRSPLTSAQLAKRRIMLKRSVVPALVLTVDPPFSKPFEWIVPFSLP
jgi:lysylphosphatidylglycerol synthetase-like protein (DUF2156 family)